MNRLGVRAFVGPTLAIVASTTPAMALITNGDFEAGNTGFTTDYTYVAPGAGALVPQGVYTVHTDPNFSHGSFVSMGDHTTGSGNMMILNGMAGDTEVWEQTVNGLTIGATYTFSFYASSVFSGSPATLDLRLDNASLGSQALTAATNQWDLFTQDFVASSTSHVLSIVDLNGAAGGNDFAIDDISLVVPEPATMLALAAGAAALMRRRRK